LTKLGTPPPGWVKAFNRQNGDLVRYRNAVHHATRFDQLPPKERREAVQLFAEQLQHLKDWWPEHPYQEQEPRLEENPLVTALQELSHDPRSAGPLVRELGFTPVNNPTDLIGPGSTSQLAVDLRGDVDRLFRVGQKTFGSAGAVAVYVAYLSEWRERSAERERYRRRLARAITLHGQGDARFIVIMLDGRDHGGLDVPGAREVEIVYPRQRAGRPFGTVRAVIDRLSPTRYHRDLLRELSIADAPSILDVTRCWNKAFDVERVTKTFYEEFRDLRDRLAEAFVAQNLGNPAFMGMGLADFDAPSVSASVQQREFRQHVLAFASRQLNRILFLWFLQQKGWLGSEYLGEAKEILVDLFRRRPKGEDAYFREVLVPLFFDALGTPLNDALHLKTQDGFGVMLDRVEPPVALPFLGGGLFRADADPFERTVFGLENGVRTVAVNLPDVLFDPVRDNRQPPARGTRGGRRRSVLGMLQSYRFTTQESTPDDQSVDPDPELLGKVFENLYQADERHESGAYYTPREVVRYMCRQTLDGYLKARAGIDQATLDWLREEALDWRVTPRRLSAAQQRSLEEALDEVTVIDPAVGSGAFLVGMLQEIVLLRRGIAAARTDREVARGSHDVFEWKRHAITRSLHGVDINPTAVEICRLRLWLSLVIDYAPRYLSEITPLPNLDLGVLAGDSLVDRMGAEPFANSLPFKEVQTQLGITEAGSAEADLLALKGRYDALNDNEKLTTNDVRRLRDLADQVREARLRLARADLFKTVEKAEAALRKLDCDRRPNAAVCKRARADREALAAMGAGLQADAPHMKPFLWPLAFPQMQERRGFDIVVANPPYIRQETLSPIDQKAYEAAFPEVFTGTVDILVPFYARGVQLLREGGWLAYITSNKYMRAAYGEKLRGYLPKRLQIQEVVDFGDLPVFAAAAYPAVVVGRKAPEPNPDETVDAVDLNLPIRRRILEDKRSVNVDGVRNELDGLTGLIAANRASGFTQRHLRPSGWILEDAALIRLFERLMNEGTPLGEYVNGRMYYGIKTGLNEAFVIDEATKESLITADPRSEELIRPWLRGRDIKRWKVELGGRYLISLQNSGDRDAQNVWANSPSEEEATRIFSEAYPAIYGHMRRWEKGLRSRADQGRYWWELRACAYYSEFGLPKVIMTHFLNWSRFAYDLSGAIHNNAATFIVSPWPSLAALLNSTLGWFVLSTMGTRLQNGYTQLFVQFFEKFPVPSQALLNAHETAAKLDTMVTEATENGKADEAALEAMVGDLYDLGGAERIALQSWADQQQFYASVEAEQGTGEPS
jgi:adenine-specific DNA-methyltransferase